VIAVLIAMPVVAGLRVDKPTRPRADPVAQLHRTTDSLVDLTPVVPGWRTFAFVSNEDVICGGSVSASTVAQAVACWMSTAQAMASGSWIALPAFQALPPPEATGGKAYIIVSCGATPRQSR